MAIVVWLGLALGLAIARPAVCIASVLMCRAIIACCLCFSESSSADNSACLSSEPVRSHALAASSLRRPHASLDDHCKPPSQHHMLIFAVQRLNIELTVGASRGGTSAETPRCQESQVFRRNKNNLMCFVRS